MEYLFRKDIILSTGIGHKSVKEALQVKQYQIKCKRKKPLGNIWCNNKCSKIKFTKHYLIINGDTVFDANLKNI